MPDLLLFALTVAWAALALLFLAATGRIYLHREELPVPGATGAMPGLSIVIPARDEAANIGECLQCITQQDYPEAALEVIVVDDNSSDDTAAIVGEIAARDARIRLIKSAPLPEGWMGKAHACWQGAAAASGDWLLFVDADTYLKPTAARAALDYARASERGFISLIPFQRIISVGERLVLPGVFLGFAAAVDFRRVNDPYDPFAIANGQFLLFSRDAYERIGGHQAIRGESMDDLAFARAAKRLRISAYTLFAEQQIETRMYRSLAAVWKGFSKNAVQIMHATSVLSTIRHALVSFGLAAGTVLPIVMLAGDAQGDGTGLAQVSYLLSLATFGVLALFAMLTLRTFRVPVYYLPAVPLGMLAHGAIIINAWVRQRQGRREWKGRQY